MFNELPQSKSDRLKFKNDFSEQTICGEFEKQKKLLRGFGLLDEEVAAKGPAK